MEAGAGGLGDRPTQDPQVAPDDHDAAGVGRRATPPAGRPAADDWLFTSRRGDAHVHHGNFRQRVWVPARARARLCDKHRDGELAAAKSTGRDPEGCGCPGALTKSPRIHDLRHTHVSWLIDAGIGLVAIQQRLGHESIQTTIDVYGDLMPDLQVQAAQAASHALAGLRQLPGT